LATPANHSATPANYLATPANYLATPANYLATPANYLATPANYLATPAKRLVKWPELRVLTENGYFYPFLHMNGLAGGVWFGHAENHPNDSGCGVGGVCIHFH
jgi:hypothetical protein